MIDLSSSSNFSSAVSFRHMIASYVYEKKFHLLRPLSTCITYQFYQIFHSYVKVFVFVNKHLRLRIAATEERTKNMIPPTQMI